MQDLQAARSNFANEEDSCSCEIDSLGSFKGPGVACRANATSSLDSFRNCLPHIPQCLDINGA
jgi:hypothetical protein